MDLFAVLIAYAALTGCFIFLLLFGESPVFTSTPIQRAHYFFTQGLCDGGEWLVQRCCGARGERALDACYVRCCDRPNPALQISYLIMLAGAFFMYSTNVLSLLPNPFAGGEHVLYSIASVALSLSLFIAACRSDPGAVSSANLAAHSALYPLDGHIWPAKDCDTCGFARPARSKHCRVCGKCVARFDHHCAWINNCVGLKNMRIFLAFLLANLAMCCYGCMVCVLVVGGEMERRGLWHMRVMDWSTGQLVQLSSSPKRMLEWALFSHPLPVALALFLAVAGLLMATFTGYQAYLLTRGMTQYEVYRWRDLHVVLQHAAEEASAEQNHQGQQGLVSHIQQKQQHQRVAETGGQETRMRSKQASKGTGLSMGQHLTDKAPTDVGGSCTPSVLQGDGGVLSGGTCSSSDGRLPSRAWGWKPRQRVQVFMPINTYQKGFWSNLSEVLSPDRHLAAAFVRQAVAGDVGSNPSLRAASCTPVHQLKSSREGCSKSKDE